MNFIQLRRRNIFVDAIKKYRRVQCIYCNISIQFFFSEILTDCFVTLNSTETYILRRNLDAETTKVKLNVVVQAGKERRQGTAGVLKPGAATRGCFMILGVRRKGFGLTVIG